MLGARKLNLYFSSRSRNKLICADQLEVLMTPIHSGSWAEYRAFFANKSLVFAV